MKVKDETLKKIISLEEEFKEKVKGIILNEAREANIYKGGDILEDHFQIGRVIRAEIGVNIDSYIYEVVYKCERLTKKLKPYKKAGIVYIYLNNVKRKLN